MSRILAPEPLQSTHQLETFDCGEVALNEWLQRRALKNEILGASRTFVACADNTEVKGEGVEHIGAKHAVGYYALAAGSVAHSLVSSKTKRNMPDPIPVMVLGRLAVDKQWQGHGLGYSLLQDALLRSKAAAEFIGARALLVHALSDTAKQFYEHFGFKTSLIEKRTLMLLLSEIGVNRI